MTSVPESEEAGRALIGTVLGGRYKIEALIGTGGMGAVYRAEHVHMRKAVAVKVLHREMTLFPEVVARFEREAVAAGRIEHPHVAAATDFGRLDNGAFYMVLEFVEGQSLGALIKQHGALPEQRALRIGRQIADALSAAHAAGIVHRDLKPDNVMLLERDGRELVKVLDFGIAKVELASSGDKALTQLGTIFGTPEYMAPEQAQGLEVDARADLYTLGLILYEMLSGVSPFRNDELIVVLTRQITADPPPLPETLTAGTRELVQALLKKSAEERPRSAVEVRDRLDELLRKADAPELAPLSPAPLDEAMTKPIRVEISDPAHARTALAMPAPSRLSFSAVLGMIRRRGLDRPIALRGYAVPLWALLASGAVLALVTGLALTLVLVSDSETPRASSSAPEEPAPEPDVLAFVAKAENGDRVALARLSKRPAEGRTLLEWRALGHGEFRAGDLKAGLALYAEALRAKPELAVDPIVLDDVRRAVDHPELAVSALELAGRAMGAHGADLLYDVWDTQKNAQNSETAKRARALLDEEPAKYRRSPALAALLRLQAAMKRPKCGELKQLLPELVEHADERSLSLLGRLSERRGCGFLGLADCYSCLRGGKDLANALANARARPRPSFAPAPAPSSSASATKPAARAPR